MSMQMIKELRDRTLAPFGDCKKAIEATGDVEKAIEWLRENGAIKAAKKAGAVAAEGVVYIAQNAKKLVIYEVNSQTDFVAGNDMFLALVDELGEALLNDASEKELESITTKGTATIGEKIVLRRPTVIVKEAGKAYGAYVHTNKRVAAIVVTEGGKDEIARNVAMHVASMNPEFLDSASVPAAKLKEITAEVKEAMDADPKNASKPDAIKTKILEGMISRKLSEISLVDQTFVMEDMKVKAYLDNHKAVAVAMHRLAVGEGIEKPKENFAEEVAAQMKK